MTIKIIRNRIHYATAAILTWFSQLRITTIFLLFAGVVGGCFIVIVPPFQGWDETEHFYRSYQISELNVRADKVVAPNVSQAPETAAPGYGGYLPSNLVSAVHNLRFNHNAEGAYVYSDISKAENNNTHYEVRQAIRFDNTAIYSPAGYLPQASAIALARAFDMSPIHMLYAARLAVFVVWLILMYWAIRLLPSGKRLYAIIALNPVAIFLATTLSPDAFATAFVALAVALVLRLRASPQAQRNIVHITMLFGALLLAVLIKNVYLPLVFIALLIPRTLLKNIYKVVIITGIIVVGLGWNISIAGMTQSIPEYFTITDHIDAKDQLLFMMQHPLHSIGVLLWNIFGTNSVIFNFSYNGTLVENRLPDWTIMVWGVVFLYAVLTARNIKQRAGILYDRLSRYVPMMIAGAIIIMILVSMYIGWTPVGSKDILGVQGRYFIPISFLFVPILMSERIKLIRFNKAIHAALFIVLAVALSAVTISLLVRYTIGISEG